MKLKFSQVILTGFLLLGIPVAAIQAGQPQGGGGNKPATAPAAQAAPADPKADAPPPPPPPPTVINLSPTGAGSLQLSVQVNGTFAYPFMFTANPPLLNGIKMDPKSGEINYTLTDLKAGSQNTTITVTDTTGATVATSNVTFLVGPVPLVTIGSAPKAAPPAGGGTPNNKSPMIAANTVYEGGDTISGSLKPVPPSTTCTSTGAAVTLKKENSTTKTNTTGTAIVDSNCGFSYQFNSPFKAEDKANTGDIITASTDTGSATSTLTVTPQNPPNIFGEELRAIVGYQQAGASSSDFNQNWFVDFYISRPVFNIFDRKSQDVQPTNNHFRWWGNVRIASFPQAGNETVAATATSLPVQFGALKLNQLAEGGEFLTGLESEIYHTPPLRGFSENTRQTFEFGLIAGGGATGFFSSPSNNVPVFQVPTAGPQLTTFRQYYGSVGTQYVGFISPDLPRFPKQYLAGVRLTTRYVDPSGTPLTTPPAMLAVTLGQNQVITAGRLTGVVARFEAFYPLPFGNRGSGKAGAFSSIYLFATAQMRLGGNYLHPPSIALAPPPMGTTVNAYDPTVTLITTQSNRDVYRIGFGVDLINLISQLSSGTSKNSTGNATPPPAAVQPPAAAAAPAPAPAPPAGP